MEPSAFQAWKHLELQTRSSQEHLKAGTLQVHLQVGKDQRNALVWKCLRSAQLTILEIGVLVPFNPSARETKEGG